MHFFKFLIIILTKTKNIIKYKCIRSCGLFFPVYSVVMCVLEKMPHQQVLLETVLSVSGGAINLTSYSVV